MKGQFKYNSKIYNSHQTNRQKRSKNKILLLLITLVVVIGGYFALPKILKSNPKTEEAKVTTATEHKMMTNNEQIIKTIPLPDIK